MILRNVLLDETGEENSDLCGSMAILGRVEPVAARTLSHC